MFRSSFFFPKKHSSLELRWKKKGKSYLLSMSFFSQTKLYLFVSKINHEIFIYWLEKSFSPSKKFRRGTRGSKKRLSAGKWKFIWLHTCHAASFVRLLCGSKGIARLPRWAVSPRRILCVSSLSRSWGCCTKKI